MLYFETDAWATQEYEFGGYIEYTFPSPKKVEKYTIVQQATHNGYNCVPRAPKPNPNPESTGDRAILVVTMTTGLEKEYDLSMTEVKAFID